MSHAWRTARFSEVLDIVNGRNQRAVQSESGAYPIYGSGGVMGYASDYLCEAGTTVIGRKGSINSPIYVGQRFWNVDTAFGLAPKSGLDSRFLYRFCEHYDFATHNKGTAVPSLVKSNLLQIEMPAPPLLEQGRIVAILDEAFEDIAIAEANVQMNIASTRAVFDAELEAVFATLPDAVARPIGEVGQVFDGPHATPRTIDTGPIFLGISALQDGRVNLGATRHISEADFVTWTRRVRPQAGDVVFSYETRLGQAAVIPEDLECCLGRRMGLVRLRPDEVDSLFFVYQYISPMFRRFLDSKTIHGATVDRISITDFPSFTVMLPALDRQRSISARLSAVRVESDQLAALCHRKLAALDELKKSLLHEAFSGNL